MRKGVRQGATLGQGVRSYMPKHRGQREGPPPSPPGSGVVGDDVGKHATPYGGFACLEVSGGLRRSVIAAQEKIPKAWLYEGEGARDGIVKDLHVTLLLKVPNHYNEAISGLRKAAESHPKVEYTIAPPEVSACSRIKTAEVICVSCSVVSPHVESLRSHCMRAVESYCRYPGAGHLTLAYVHKRFEEPLNRLVEEINGGTDWSKVTGVASSVSLRMRRDGTHQLALGAA
ncbi:hypothetical protein DIPPA_11147 [Diplonema papillatum]|nr:hypothetical protein DIPPA_11147 [Diplonema papillatum]